MVCFDVACVMPVGLVCLCCYAYGCLPVWVGYFVALYIWLVCYLVDEVFVVILLCYCLLCLGGDLDASGGVLWRLCSVVVICVVYLDFVVVWMGVLLIVLFLTFIWYAYGYWFGGFVYCIVCSVCVGYFKWLWYLCCLGVLVVWFWLNCLV